MRVYPSRYQITVFVCVKRLMFQLFKLRAGSHSKSENYTLGYIYLKFRSYMCKYTI
jgi:hypothetical protein